MSAGEWSSVRSMSILIREAITKTAHAKQEPRLTGDRLNLLPQVEHLRVDGAIGDGDAFAPGGVDQLRPRQDTAAIAEQHVQKAKLGWCDLHPLAGTTEFGPIEVNLAVAKL